MTVSVVIPTTGDWEHIWRLQLVLESLVLQNEQPLEVLVVDADGSTMEVQEVVRYFADQLPVRCIRLLESERAFRAGEARNAGVANLRFKPDRVLFLDGDCVAQDNLVRSHSGYHPSYIVAGARCHVEPRDMPDLALKEVMQATTRPDKRMRHPENWETYECCYTCHLSIGYDLFNKVGGFWTRVPFGEDRELAMRAMRAGGQVIFLPEHAVYHLDHPVWRPTSRDELEADELMLADSLKLPGYLRG
jgi:glycosyltransferase involved in cell wall biosynthesis